MIKVTRQQPNAHQLVFRLEGQLTCETVKQCAGVLASDFKALAVTVDLSGLTSLDQDGRGFLIGLRERGCRLLGASLYIKRVLEEV